MKLARFLLFTLSITLFCIQLSAQEKPDQKKLHHVLLFQWADTLNTESKSEVMNLFQGLPPKIKGFERIDILDLSNSSDDFDTILIMVFHSEEALKEYEKHPDHVLITKIAPPLLNGFSEFDYWK